jgi:hypothetical protein
LTPVSFMSAVQRVMAKTGRKIEREEEHRLKSDDHKERSREGSVI